MYIHVYIIFLVIGHFFIFFNILQLNFQPSNNSFLKPQEGDGLTCSLSTCESLRMLRPPWRSLFSVVELGSDSPDFLFLSAFVSVNLYPLIFLGNLWQ